MKAKPAILSVESGKISMSFRKSSAVASSSLIFNFSFSSTVSCSTEKIPVLS
jgi:hypothetical protein